MARFLYRCLLALYPRSFRERFGDEMMLTFDEARSSNGALRLLADAIRTLARQWSRPPAPALPAASAAIGPVFHIFEPRPLPPSAVFLGLAAASMLLSAVQYATANWSSFHLRMGASRGTFQPNTLGIVAEQSAVESAVLGSGPMENEWAKQARQYIGHLPVLRALDANGDSLLSAAELFRAPEVLRALDQDHDSAVSAEEAGAHFDGLPPDLHQRARRDFMTLHPAHRALDADGDFLVSEDELRGAAVLLRKLDLTGDGILHPAEYLPNVTVQSILGTQQ